MNRLKSNRLLSLATTFAAVAGLVAVLKLSAEDPGEAALPQPRFSPKANGMIVVDGVGYRPTRVVLPQDLTYRQTYRANVEAHDPGRGELLWKVTVREGTWPESKGGMLVPSQVNFEQFHAQFALKLSPKGREISAETPDGGVYLVDPETRRVRVVRAPTPPKRPILDARLRGRTLCEVHGPTLTEGVVPIYYGFARIDPSLYEARRTRFPYARLSVDGGCVGGVSREARVLYCQECREAEREWTSRATKPRRSTGRSGDNSLSDPASPSPDGAENLKMH